MYVGIYLSNLLKVGVPNCGGEWLGVDLSMDNRRTCLREDLEFMFKFINHSRCNSQQNWGNQYDRITTRRISTLMMILKKATKFTRKVAMGTFWIS